MYTYLCYREATRLAAGMQEHSKSVDRYKSSIHMLVFQFDHRMLKSSYWYRAGPPKSCVVAGYVPFSHAMISVFGALCGKVRRDRCRQVLETKARLFEL